MKRGKGPGELLRHGVSIRQASRITGIGFSDEIMRTQRTVPVCFTTKIDIDCGGAAYNPFEQAEEDVLSVTILKNMSKRLEYRWENDRNIIDTAL